MNRMGRGESRLVGLTLAILVPLAALVLGWWGSAVLSMSRVLQLSARGIGLSAVTGLFLGVLLDLRFLSRWTVVFYQAPWPVLVLAYLFGSAVALAFCMGFPIGNLLWGTLAGLYVGRRQRHAGTAGRAAEASWWKTSTLTALVTSAEALPIGVLALQEEFAVRTLASATGLSMQVLQGSVGVAIVVGLSVALAGIQFLCTRGAARRAYRMSTGRKLTDGWRTEDH